MIRMCSYNIENTWSEWHTFSPYLKRKSAFTKNQILIISIWANSHQFLFLSFHCNLVNSGFFSYFNTTVKFRCRQIWWRKYRNLRKLDRRARWKFTSSEKLHTAGIVNFLFAIQVGTKVFPQYVDLLNPIFSPPAAWIHKMNHVYASSLSLWTLLI